MPIRFFSGYETWQGLSWNWLEHSWQQSAPWGGTSFWTLTSSRGGCGRAAASLQCPPQNALHGQKRSHLSTREERLLSWEWVCNPSVCPATRLSVQGQVIPSAGHNPGTRTQCREEGRQGWHLPACCTHFPLRSSSPPSQTQCPTLNKGSFKGCISIDILESP